jgi:hypothetical protein
VIFSYGTIIAAVRKWVASAGEKFLQAQHVGSYSSLVKMHSQW